MSYHDCGNRPAGVGQQTGRRKRRIESMPTAVLRQSRRLEQARQAALHDDNAVGRQVLQHLGFRVVEDSIPYVRLRWTPIQIPAPSSKDS
jgi:hypothetical protein